MNVSKRLGSELSTLMFSQNEGITAFPEGDNLFNWRATVAGSRDSVYEGLEYKLSLSFPSDYPFNPPTIKFVTPCFHPNVDEDGNICLDILKENWSAAYNVQTILLSLQQLLADANVDSPLNVYAAALWNKPEYKDILLKKYSESKI